MRCALYCVAAALALAGCSKAPPSPQAALVEGAMAAYVKGDMPAFESFVAKAQADAATAQAVADYDTACTQAATEARRAIDLAAELNGLDASPVFSMSEEARYIFLSADLTEAQRYFPNKGARMGCEKADSKVYFADKKERSKWLAVMMTKERAWQVSLRQQNPTDYEQRLKTARQQLSRNHMGEFVPVRSGMGAY